MTYQSEVLADAPLFYYRLGEASGTTAVDSSGNGRDGTYVNAPTLGVPGLLVGDADTAVAFDGTNDHVAIANGSWMNPTAYTVEALIKPDVVSGVYLIIDQDGSGASTSRKFQFRVSAGKLSVVQYTTTAATTVNGSTTLTAGTTYHVAAKFAAGVVTLYVNGVVDVVSSVGGSLRTSSYPMTVGARYSGSGTTRDTFFDGVIDEAAYYGVALSDERIADHYAAAQGVVATGTLAATLPAATVDLAGTYTAPPPTGALSATLPAVTATLAGAYVAPVVETPVGSLTAALPAVTAALTGSYVSGDGVVESSSEFANDGYNYTGTARVFYEPPIDEPLPTYRREKVRRIHQSLPAPTLVDGRPT